MALLLARTFWPALLIGLGIGISWRFVSPGRLRTNLQIAASLLVFVPQLIIIFFLYQSISLLLYQEALLSLWMIGSAALLTSQLWARRNGQSEMPHHGNGVTGERRRVRSLLKRKSTRPSGQEKNHGAGLGWPLRLLCLGALDSIWRGHSSLMLSIPGLS